MDTENPAFAAGSVWHRLTTRLNTVAWVKVGHPYPPRGRVAALFQRFPLEQMIIDYSVPTQRSRLLPQGAAPLSARYVLRFDDLCPTMSWGAWREIEALLVDTGVVPILAVVPANADPALCVDPPGPGFWDTVRRWQERGWTIGLHGYTHQYVTQDAGILGVNPWSEFAGLPHDRQRDKLTKGLQIFAAQGVRADVWVAPAHSFDATTLRALRESGLTCVSDGFMPYPGRDEQGMTWVPQQIWRFYPMPFGVWTVCVHHNLWGSGDVAALGANLRRYADRMTTLAEIQRRYGERSLGRADHAFSGAFRLAFEIKHARRRLGRGAVAAAAEG